MSRIAEKIHLSDYRICNGRELWQLPMNKFPLFFPSVGLIFGIFLQTFLEFSFFRLLCVGFGLTVFAVWVVCLHRKPGFALLLSFLSFIFLGAALVRLPQNLSNRHISRLTPSEPVLAVVRGRVVSNPANNRAQQADNRNYSMSFYLDISEIRTPNGFCDAEGVVYGRLSSIPFSVLPEDIARKGDIITFHCRLQRPAAKKERWQFDFRKFLYQKNIEVCAYGKYPAVIRHSTSDKLAANRRFNEHLITDEQDISKAALVEALTLGRRGNLPDYVVEAFRTSGLAHLISLSGMHIGIITCGLWAFLRLAGIRQRAAGIILIAAVCLFLYAVTARPPAIRACIIALVFAASKVFCRNSSGVNSLSLSAIITLLLNPRDLFNPGWQLSFLCVLAIILLTKPIANRLSAVIRQCIFFWRALRRKPNSPSLEVFSFAKLGRAVLLAVSTSLAAWLVSTPIIAYHFGAIYPLSWAYTVLLAPLLWLTINVSFLGIIFGSFFGTAASILSGLLINCVVALSQLGYSEILTGFVPLYIVLAASASMVVFGISRFLLNKNLLRLSISMIAISLIMIVVWDRRTFGAEQLRLALLPMGHGQCVVLEFGSKKTFMLDCGSSTFDDCGKRIAAPYLRSRRIKSIDALIISHPHSDHINGVEYILEKFNPDEVFINNDSAAYGLRGSVVSWQSKTIFDTDGKWMLEIMPPLKKFEGWNDNSLIVLIDYNGIKVMLPGDIEKLRQQELIEQGITADIVLTPHHDSQITTLEHFYDKIQAQKIVSTSPEKLMTPKTITLNRTR